VQGLPDADIRTIVEGVAPKLDVLINGSTDVNLGRAVHSASVAMPTAARRRAVRRSGRRKLDPPDEESPEPIPVAPLDVRLLKAAEVLALSKDLPKHPEPPDVEFSLFVQLEQDLDREVREQALTSIRRVTRRARWKQDTAAVEVTGPKVRELHAIPGVSYVEPDQTLHSPEPILGRATAPPDRDMRRVPAEARRHRYGRDVLVGIIDVGGFDFAHEDFLEPGGNATRWVAIWDQGGTVRPSPAKGRTGRRFEAWDYGSEVLKSHMDAAIAGASARGMAATSLEPQSSMVAGSHGTHVASIAAGGRGVARRAHVAGVLISLRPDDMAAVSSFYDSTRIADAVDYLLAVAAELGGADGPLPVSINISLGTNGHAHDTSSAMARWIDSALTTPGRCVTVAAGNAGQVQPSAPSDMRFVAGRVHAAGTFAATNLRHELGWVVAGGEIADISENEMEIWYSPQDRIDVEVRPPGGAWIGPIRPGENIRSEVLPNGTVLSVHSETYYPANGANRISILLSPFYGPVRDAVRSIGPIAPGEWRVRLTGTVVRDGRYDAWIERDDPRPLSGPRGRLWAYPSSFSPGSYTDDRMINSLACAERLLSVANVDLARNAAHVTSSRGPTRDGRFKPDIGAAGTAVVAARRLRSHAALDRDDGHEHGQSLRVRCGRAHAGHRTEAHLGPDPGHYADDLDAAGRTGLRLAVRHRIRCDPRGGLRRGGSHLRGGEEEKPAVKLTVFYATDGDSLMLSSSDGHHALIDGGRTKSFRAHTWKTLQDMAEAGQALDLVVVSHIDADHISGILWLMKAVAAWAVYDYQTTDGGNPDFGSRAWPGHRRSRRSGTTRGAPRWEIWPSPSRPSPAASATPAAPHRSTRRRSPPKPSTCSTPWRSWPKASPTASSSDASSTTAPPSPGTRRSRISSCSVTPPMSRSWARPSSR